jgi:hypothetical protein
MGILIGMDEAGYGPNYGPLVVAATAWRAPDPPCRAPSLTSAPTPNLPPTTTAQLSPQSAIRNPQSAIDTAPDLYRLLRRIVAKKPGTHRLAVADSKKLYSPGHGLGQLERGLHTVLRSIGHAPTTWPTLVERLRADPHDHHKNACWPHDFEIALPIDADAEELQQLATEFGHACAAADVQPLLVRARLVYPAEFNDLVTHHGTKGAALSHITATLLREVIEAVDTSRNTPRIPPSSFPPPPSLHVVCDKHGGRNFYAALLQHHFPEHWIEPLHESRAESRYEWGPPEARTCVAFRMNGERFLPTALASMTAKYLRELSMRAFNQFWQARIPNLRPTAGYPQDARRFREEIAAAQRELRIDDHILWRNR